MRLLDKMLPGLIKRGELTIITPDGKTHRFGAPDPELKPVTVRLMDRRVALQIARDPTLGTVETFMDDRLRLEQGEIIDLILIIRRNRRWEERTRPNEFLKKTGKLRHRLSTLNWKSRSLKNVQHHYDIGNDLYRLFLDPDMQYSCAYFTDPVEQHRAGPARQEGAYRLEDAPQAGPEGARHRLRLGRPRALPEPRRRRRRARSHAVQGAAGGGPRSAPRRPASPTG